MNSDHYEGTGITYLGFPLWDAPGCNLIPYLGIAADFICSAIDQSGIYLHTVQLHYEQFWFPSATQVWDNLNQIM